MAPGIRAVSKPVNFMVAIKGKSFSVSELAAAGVTAGALVAYGVGDYVHNLIADAPKQWHEHGVLLGSAIDLGAAGVSTWDDTTHLASDVGGLASGRLPR